MTAIHIRQLKAAITRDFAERIDVSDAPATARPSALLSRGLAAFVVQHLTGCSLDQAAAASVDGFGDHGIDAIAIDGATAKIILVQTKWHEAGTKTIDLGDTLKFIEGLKALTDGNYEAFNAKLKPLIPQIEAALETPQLKICLVVATNGPSKLGSEAQAVLDKTCGNMNEAGEIIEQRVLGLRELRAMLVEGVTPPQVNLHVTLQQWGKLSEPYEALYGMVSGSEIAAWYKDYGDKLFERNIRRALGGTAVNAALVRTLRERPSDFWYFNNGITVLCKRMQRLTPTGISAREVGQFGLTGISVVNGAQTVASIDAAARQDAEAVADARVWVRLISLEGCPDGFGVEVTRATNTQNSVENRDFVALDSVQERLRLEFASLLGRRYAIKRGEQSPTGDEGCSVEEATVALACASDTGYAVLAKSSIGRLWETNSEPYRRLFPPDITAARVWHSVQVLRHVDASLSKEVAKRVGREKSIAIQGNRIVAHLVLDWINVSIIDDPFADWQTQLKIVDIITPIVLHFVTEHVNDEFADNYITSLFKNASRCRRLVRLTRGDLEKSPANSPDYD